MAHHIGAEPAPKLEPKPHPMDTKGKSKVPTPPKLSKKEQRQQKAEAKANEKIGPFTVAQIDAQTKKRDSKNPISFKKWARQYAEGYDNTLEAFRTAYDADMKIGRAELKALDRIDKTRFKKAAKTIEDPRTSKVRDLEDALAWFTKLEIIGVAPRVIWGEGRIVVNISYMPKGLELLKRVFKKQRMLKHLTRVNSLNSKPT